MSTAPDVEGWVEAINLFIAVQIEHSILKFQTLEPTTRILFNIAYCFRCWNETSIAKKVIILTHIIHQIFQHIYLNICMN